MPKKPRWLLAIPDAIAKLEKLKRETLTRRDLEVLFTVSRVTATEMMKRFGAERVAQTDILPKAKLLEHLRGQRKRAPFRHEAERRQRVVDELERARIVGIRVPVTNERLSARLSNTPAGITVMANRIEVTFATPKEAAQQLYTVAAILNNDYTRFEQLVETGRAPESPNGADSAGRHAAPDALRPLRTAVHDEPHRPDRPITPAPRRGATMSSADPRKWRGE